jgi:ABC-2 type transport system ATP-binding protein
MTKVSKRASAPSDNGRDAPTAMIEVEGLTRHYGQATALRDVSFRVNRGEIVGFLGPNGAGKTTAMRIITGYLPPSAGAVRVAGHDVVEDSLSARRAIGYLPESTPLYRDMTVRGYLEYMARLRDVTDRDAAVEAAMGMTGVAHRADDLIDQLSKGYRQRVGIAQALVHGPPVVILDEPTIGLDPRQIREVRGLIDRLRGEHTVLLSTHILPEAQEVCDRVLIIDRGQIVAEDTPTELTARLHGGERIRIAVPAGAAGPKVEAALKAVQGVADVEERGDGAYIVVGQAGAAPRPELARAVIDGGWPLLELTPVGMTLEEIFLQLTAQDDAPDGLEEDEADG